MVDANDICCPRFDPEPWDEQVLEWENKPFVKDRVRSFLHIPLNFGTVVTRNMGKIEPAGAKQDQPIILADENSLWGADVYISVTKDVPSATLAHLSESFQSKVFEGPFSEIRTWCKQMKEYVGAKGLSSDNTYFYYTTCPKCAKEHGKNYVVILAQTG